MKKVLPYLLTITIIGVAVLAILYKYQDYVSNPWTRDGQVQALVIQITPRVSGPIINLPIRDNQFVKAGDLLFEIDPRTFQASLEEAKAQLEQTGGNVQAQENQVDGARAAVNASKAAIEQAKSAIAQQVATMAKNKAEYDRQKQLLKKNATSQKTVERVKANYEVSVQQKLSAEAGLNQTKAQLAESRATLAKTKSQLVALGDSNPQSKAALAAVKTAELNLEFTRVTAPVDGYITNLALRLGSQAVANQPSLALVDTASYWINGFFKENTIAEIRSGNRAIITLMTYPDTPIEGRVDSIGWGIAQEDGSTGFDLLPTISPTFEWIRLAQRVPVRIQLGKIENSIQLRVGTTCSVMVMTDTRTDDNKNLKPIPPAPRVFQ
jgi:multidrug resistance efflux pump